MNTTEQQVENFRHFALQRLRRGATATTIDELYDQWRFEHPSEDEQRGDVLALQASLRDLKRGETGRPFETFQRDFRTRHGLGNPE